MSRYSYGHAGEQEACDYLRSHGWTILERNLVRGRNEIDIVAVKRRLTIFVEVKRRSDTELGLPIEAVGKAKQRNILRAALLYMQENDLMDARVRFDVIEVLPGEIRHIEDAFDASELPGI